MAQAYRMQMQVQMQMQTRANDLPWGPKTCMRYIIVKAFDRTKGSGDFSAPFAAGKASVEISKYQLQKSPMLTLSTLPD